MKVLNIEQLTNGKFLNHFQIRWKLDNGKEITYYFASRKSLEDVKALILNHTKKTDAVRAVPYFYKDGEMYVVLLKEFRYVINDYLISTPAGLVDDGETELEAIYREVNEEIGGTIKEVTKSFAACYTSVGAIDESVVCFYVEIEPELANQHLDQTENLSSFVIKFSELPKVIEEVYDYQSRYLLQSFYYEQENKRLKQQLENLQEKENSIYFVTTNKGKLVSAQDSLSRFGITLNYVDHEVTEPNINDIEYIATYKVKEAYEILKKPCITLDSGFYIPNYPGKTNFPGAFPKRELLEKIGIDGLMDKMKNVQDRECYFKECVAYYDGKQMKYFYSKISGKLSKEIRQGNNPTQKWSELWYVFIPEGFEKTMAEMTEQERESLKTTETDSLLKFANWFSKQ